MQPSWARPAHDRNLRGPPVKASEDDRGMQGLSHECDGWGCFSNPPICPRRAARPRGPAGFAGSGCAGGRFADTGLCSGLFRGPTVSVPILLTGPAGRSSFRPPACQPRPAVCGQRLGPLPPVRRQPCRPEPGVRRGPGAAPPDRRHPQLQICNTESDDGGRWGSGAKLVWPPTALCGYVVDYGLGRVAGDCGGRLLLRRRAIRHPVWWGHHVWWEWCWRRDSSRVGQRGLGTC
jgi:hypothetical protein